MEALVGPSPGGEPPVGGLGSSLLMSTGGSQEFEEEGVNAIDMEGVDQPFIGMPSIVLVVLTLYVMYYLIVVVKKPEVSCNSTLREFLNVHCPLLQETYWPTIWCVEARIQTVLRGLFQSCPDVPFIREILPLDDGGEVALDWAGVDSARPGFCTSSEPRPVVIILPGLTGSSKESYARHIVRECIKLGYRSVVLNYRGVGGSELKTSRTYCATKTDDLESAIHHLEKKFPGAPILGIGVSMGGLLLTNYLASKGKDARLVAGMAVSVPWNIFASNHSLEQGVNGVVFNQYLCNCLKQTVQPHVHLFSDKCDMEQVFKSRTIRDFDESFTVKLFGYKDSTEYYTEACIDRKIHDIKVPMLYLNAADDPFSPGPSIPLEDASRSSHVMIVMTARGGHIAFFDGCFLPHEISYIQRVFSQYSCAVILHAHEIVPTLNSSPFPYRSMMDVHVDSNEESQRASHVQQATYSNKGGASWDMNQSSEVTESAAVADQPMASKATDESTPLQPIRA